MHERVVIVEDESLLRGIIARNLAHRGLRVTEAGTAGEALSLLRAECPNLLLLDINLPDRSGWDVLRELRENGIEVPTIVISAVQASPNRLAEFHPLAYLPKPFPIEALLRLVVGGRGRASGAPSSSVTEASLPGDDGHRATHIVDAGQVGQRQPIQSIRSGQRQVEGFPWAVQLRSACEQLHGMAPNVVSGISVTTHLTGDTAIEVEDVRATGRRLAEEFGFTHSIRITGRSVSARFTRAESS